MFLADNLSFEDHDESVCKMLIEAFKYHLLPERRLSLDSSRTRPRKSTVGHMFLLGGMDGGKCSYQIEQYDCRSNSWSKFGSLPIRQQFGAAVIDDKLYILGGTNEAIMLKSVHCLDFNLKVWTEMPSMLIERRGIGVAVLNRLIYAVGGYNGLNYLELVETFDSLSGYWRHIQSLRTERSEAGVAVLNDKIYVVGGRNRNGYLNSVECYDPHRDKWTFATPMCSKHGGTGVGVINGYLYALGGHEDDTSVPGLSRFHCVERYDPMTDAWTVVTSLSIARDAIGVSVLGDRLITVGGYDGQSSLNIVEAYDPRSNEWEQADHNF